MVEGVVQEKREGFFRIQKFHNDFIKILGMDCYIYPDYRCDLIDGFFEHCLILIQNEHDLGLANNDKSNEFFSTQGNEKIQSLQDEIARLKTTIDNLSRDLSFKEGLCNDLKDKVNEYNRVISELQDEVDRAFIMGK